MIRKTILCATVFAFVLCRAAEESPVSLSVSPATLAAFDEALDFYEAVIEEKGLSKESGLSGIFHAMFQERAAAIVQDPVAQKRAVEIHSCLKRDAAMDALQNVTNGAFSYEAIAVLHVLAQKNFAIKLSQLGYPLHVPAGDLNVVFGPKENKSVALELLERNAGFPYTEESNAVVRGKSIADCYLKQQVREHVCPIR